MAKKNIWQRLFPREDQKKSGLTIVAGNSLLSSLESEHGVTIQSCDLTVGELKAQHYRKLTSDAIAHINQIFQYIPQIVSEQATQKAVNTAFKAATEGTYRVRLDPGMHLAFSRQTPGAYRGMVFNSTNNLRSQAELFENNTPLAVTQAPQIALDIFNVTSMITGQYFMAQINSKLSELSTSVGKIEKLLDAQRHGELKAAEQELSDVMNRAEFLIRDPIKCNSAIDQLHDIQHIANSVMNTCQELCSNEIGEMSDNDKVNTIKKRIDTIAQYLLEYRYALQLYGLAVLAEVQICNIINPDELKKYRVQIESRTEQFRHNFDQYHHSTKEYLNKTHTLNDKSIVQWIASGTAFLITEGAAHWFHASSTNVGDKALSLLNHVFNDQRKQMKADISMQVKECFDPLKDIITLESPSLAIKSYIETAEKGIEFIKIGNEYYTNFPQAN